MPTPFGPAPEVNCYVFTGELTTLVDGGPNWDRAATAVEAGLAGLGLGPRDLDLILLTHHHSDHAGLGATMRRRSGARLAATAPVAVHLRALERELEAEEAYVGRLMLRHGFGSTLSREVVESEAAKRVYHQDAEVDEVVPVGHDFRLGDRTVTVHPRPGHSPFDVVFHDRRDGLLVSGDHLLGATSSSPYLHCPPGAPDPLAAAERDEVSPLPDYLESLRRTAALEVSVVLPGHGAQFGGHRELIASRLAGHRSRRGRLAARLERPLCAAEVVAELWPRLPLDRVYVAFSEVLGQLELLAREGLVARQDDGDVVRFAPRRS